MKSKYWSVVFVVICALFVAESSGQSSTNINCTSNPCQGSSSCVEERNGTHWCLCFGSYYGTYCQYTRGTTSTPKTYTQTTIPNWITTNYYGSNCAYTGCQNGGSCRYRYSNYVYSYRCYCPYGFTGTFCETYTYTTTPKPVPTTITENGTAIICGNKLCYNNATCYRSYSYTSCRCKSGYRGTYCQIKRCNKYTDPCLNGGYCYSSGTCSCNKRRYSGDRCEKVQECNPYDNRCSNRGKCVFGKCNCTIQYDGHFCENRRNCSADVPCKNGGTCYKTHCYCQSGYTGRFCEQMVMTTPGICACANGNCFPDKNGEPSCQCYNGFYGRYCDQKIPGATNITEGKWCSPINPCHEKATCVGDEYDYTCKCDPLNYFGVHCERQFVKCSVYGGDCQNGGVCKQYKYRISTGAATNIIKRCICATGYKGDYCHTEIKEYPKWMEVFSDTGVWSGTYSYNKFLIPFTFEVKTMSTGKGIVIATLKDKQTEIEMKGSSYDDVYITFNASKMTKASPRIPTHFELSGQLMKSVKEGIWVYQGKVSQPDNAIFGAFTLRPKTDKPTQSRQKSTALAAGLGAGLPILVIIVVVLVGLLFFRKRLFCKEASQFQHTQFSNSEQNVSVKM